MQTIFVSIAAFREPLLEFTLDQLFRNAYAPRRIAVGLVDQSNDDTLGWLGEKPYAGRIRLVKVDPVDSEGVSWARARAQTLYGNEDYFLQIDSHTAFKPGWDKLMIDLHRSLSSHFSKPVITAYPPGFKLEANNMVVPDAFPEGQVFKIVPDYTLSTLLPDSATLRFKTDLIPDLEAVEGFHIAGGFLFTCAPFIHEVPYDASMYFHGEEQNLSLRAWTRGWTIVHVRNDWIPVLHLYKQSGTAYDTHHWSAALEARREIKWTARNTASHQRLIQLIRNELPAPWGLGKERSLGEFIAFSGIDYARYL